MNSDEKKRLKNAIKEVKKMKRVGEIKLCHKCKKPAEIISYTMYGLQSMSNMMSTCFNCYEIRKPRKISKEHSKTCPVHSVFDEEKHYEAELRIRKIQTICQEVLKSCPPKNDSIMEYDKFKTIVGKTLWTEKPENYRFWVYEAFIEYFGLKKKLRL